MNLQEVAQQKPFTVQTQAHLKVGEYEVIPIRTGIFGLDGGAMFGTVPKVLWQKTNPTDDLNRIAMEARVLLLKSKSRTIIVDTGNGGDFVAKYGEKLGSKFAEMYGIAGSGGLLPALKANGIEPDHITDVILTHLHFDHTGGATCLGTKNEIVPTFKNATYYIQSDNLETARAPNAREKASYYSPNFEPLFKTEKVKVLKTSRDSLDNILPGINVYTCYGHTFGMQVVEIEGNGQAPCGGVLYCADLIPTSSHVRIPWIMGYDLHPLVIMEEKKEFLKRAQAKNQWLFFEHDPYCDLASLENTGSEILVKERFNIKDLS